MYHTNITGRSGTYQISMGRGESLNKALGLGSALGNTKCQYKGGEVWTISSAHKMGG